MKALKEQTELEKIKACVQRSKPLKHKYSQFIVRQQKVKHDEIKGIFNMSLKGP